MIAEKSEQTILDLDYIIELSILKVRRMQITGVREERQRLLVLETLHQCITQKIEEVYGKCGKDGMDRASAFLTVLHEAIRKLGLSRLVRFGITLPENENEYPRLKLPVPRKLRDFTGTQNAPNESFLKETPEAVEN